MKSNNLITKFFDRISGPLQPRRNIGRALQIPRIPGVPLTMETAFAVSAVFACVTVIAKSLASNRCHWDVMQSMPNGDWEYREGTSAWWLLNYQPNPEMTPSIWKMTMFICALLWGQGISEIERDIVGRPLWLWPLDPYKSYIDRDANLNKIVRWQDKVIPWKDVLVFQGPGNGMDGYNMVAQAAVTIAQMLAADQFSLKFYQHGTAMGGIVTSEQDLSQEELDDTRNELNKRVSGADQAFKLLVLGAGLKFQSVNQNQKDGLVLDTRYFLIEEVCRYFGMQPHKIAHLLRSTNNNIEHQGLEFTNDTISIWSTGAEEECTLKMFPTRSAFRVSIDTDDLAEGDAKSRAETEAIYVANGLRSRNELRRKRGWNSVGTDGDKLTVQVNMTTLDKVGQQQAQPQQAAQQLFANALRRAFRRHQHAAAGLVKANTVATTFTVAMNERLTGEVQNCRQLTFEVLRICASIGINIDATAAVTMVDGFVRENHDLMTAAFPAVDGWCPDIDLRAEDAALKLIQSTQRSEQKCLTS